MISAATDGPERLAPAQFFAAAAARDLVGIELVAAWTRHVDRWMASLFACALDDLGDSGDGLALVAVGGYGRAELCPSSDLDVLLLHARRSDVSPVAERLWYPMWDAGVKLGHSVRTQREALSLGSEDLDTATSLLDVRHLAGDPSLTLDLAEAADRAWEKDGKRWLGRLADSVDLRHERAGEVAFHLEPDLKSGRGGLRDVHALRWAGRARQVLLDDDEPTLDDGYRFLLDVRVALHLQANRPTDVLALQEQDGVAAMLGFEADALMARVASIGRSIAWRSDETWHRLRSQLASPGWSFSRRSQPIGPGLVLRDREIHLANDANPVGHPELALRAATAAAERNTRIDRSSLALLAAATPELGDPWPTGACDALVALLLAGPPAVAQIEALDQLGIWGRVLPEWAAVRSCPQRNAYHRFTVDRHLCETAANAAGLVDRVRRPDLLVLGALLHDIGKGRPGDHTELGMELVHSLATRMGLPPADVESLVQMVEHHLLLPDVATRRDLGDPDTITAVADAVGSLQTLELLHALTEADSRATGPAAWGTWKAGLVSELVERTAERLGTNAPAADRGRSFPSLRQQALLEAGKPTIEGEGEFLTLVAHDRAGLFNRVTGVLSLHGLAVRSADALSGDQGLALEHIRVAAPRADPIDWPRVCGDLALALDGRLAIPARLAERSRTYSRSYSRAGRSLADAAPQVLFDNDASASATVIEVHAADSIGLLYRITRALADLDIDIRSAKVQTLGDSVVDAFYVLAPYGAKITEPTYMAEVERALAHAVSSGS